MDVFFRHSDEHSRPWTVEGNLQPLPAQSTHNRSMAVLVRKRPADRAPCLQRAGTAMQDRRGPGPRRSLGWQNL